MAAGLAGAADVGSFGAVGSAGERLGSESDDPGESDGETGAGPSVTCAAVLHPCGFLALSVTGADIVFRDVEQSFALVFVNDAPPYETRVMVSDGELSGPRIGRPAGAATPSLARS